MTARDNGTKVFRVNVSVGVSISSVSSVSSVGVSVSVSGVVSFC